MWKCWTENGILISSDGVFKKKNLPTDIFYQNVNIRRPRRVEAVAAQVEDGEGSEEEESDDDYWNINTLE